MTNRFSQSGFTMIETLIGLGILAIVSTSIYQAYANILQVVQAAQYNSAALNIMESHVEMIRNMRYEDVGTAGGVPYGKLPQTSFAVLYGASCDLHIYVRNIDDTFDGTLGGTPNDTAPADYKLVELQVTCTTCTRYNVARMATYVAPKNLESSSKRGNLFIRVFDSAGQPVSGATVHVTNTAVSPAIDLTDVTNTAGLLQLVDTATSSAKYHIAVSRAGYSSDQTYPPGTPANPTQPDATVASQQLTTTSLAIDRVSSLTIRARDSMCQPISGFDTLMTGAKIIGTNPVVPKYSIAHSTNADGLTTLASVEWDTYALRPTDTTWDIAGAQASLSITVDPNTSHTVTWQIAPRQGTGLLVSVTDQGGTPLNDALVTVDASSATTGEAMALLDTTWDQYAEKSQLLDVSTSGSITLSPIEGSFASVSQQWLISDTIDMGTTSATFESLWWSPASQPEEIGLQSVQFQLAANNDNATWSWVGPDGTPSSFFTSPGQAIPLSLAQSRYLRYKVYLQTQSTETAPTITDVSLGFSGGCAMAGQAFFSQITGDTANLSITRQGYQPYTATISTAQDWQRISIPLTP